MNEKEAITFDKSELRSIMRAYKAMDEQAQEEGIKIGNELAGLALREIQQTASGSPARSKIADGGRVAKKSKIAELSFGYKSQRFSGGGTTQQLWPGYEFGSNKYPQFRPWSGSYNRGSRGKFIYPTLRRLQPEYTRRWVDAMQRVMRKW